MASMTISLRGFWDEFCAFAEIYWGKDLDRTKMSLSIVGTEACCTCAKEHREGDKSGCVLRICSIRVVCSCDATVK